MFGKIKSFLFENKTTKQTIAKNTVWLSISNFGGRLIKAGVIIYGARVLGTAEWGVFSYTLTISGFLALFMDPGINGILIRDASKASGEELNRLFSTTLAIKIFLLLIGVSLILFVAPAITKLPGANALFPIVAIILMLDTLRDFFSSLVRAMEKMELDAGIFLLTNLGILVFGFLLLREMPTAISFGWGYVLGDLLGVALSVFLLRNYFKKIFSSFSSKLVMPIVQSAWPFAVSGALGLLFTNTDILIIGWMRSASEVGIYSAAIRIIQILYLIPMILQFSTLPLLSRLAKSDNVKFRAVLEQTLAFVFLASIPLALGGIILGTDIMSFVFGSPYRAGGLSFQLLSMTLLFDFAASIIVNALFAYEHQKSLIVSSALGGGTNVIFDLLLIPHFGIAGSAVATLIAQAVNNSYLWYAMKKVNYFSVIPQLKKIFFASVIMAAITFALSQIGLPVAMNILLSIGVYLGLLQLLKEPAFIEIKKVLLPDKEIHAAESNQ